MSFKLKLVSAGFLAVMGGNAFADSTSNYIAGDWYIPRAINYNLSAYAAQPAANTIRCTPAMMNPTATINSVGTRVTTVATGGNIQFAIYTNDVVTLRPGTLVASTASISTAVAGPVNGALSTNVQGGPGGANFDEVFWYCVNSDNTTHIVNTINSQLGLPAQLIGDPVEDNILPTTANAAILTDLSCSAANCNGSSSTFGTWPSSLAGTTWTSELSASNMPLMVFQVFSVP